MTEPWIDQLDLLIRSRTPILWIRSSEEERIQALLTTAAERLGKRLLLRWDFVQGLQGLPNRQGEAARNPMAALDSIESLQADQPAILLLLDFNRYCDDPGISRRLRNLATSLRRQPRTLVITAPDWQLPRELEECVTVLELPPAQPYGNQPTAHQHRPGQRPAAGAGPVGAAGPLLQWPHRAAHPPGGRPGTGPPGAAR